MNRRVWTPERRARLMTLVEDGRLTVGVVEAGECLGCSSTAVADEIRRSGIAAREPHGWSPQRRWWTPARQRQLEVYCCDSRLIAPLEVVARHLGCHKATVSKRLKAIGVSVLNRQGPAMSEAQEQALIALCRGNRLDLSIPEAARRIGAAQGAVRRALVRLGVAHPAVRFWSEAKLQALRALCDAAGNLRVPLAEAARRLHCEPVTVAKAVARIRAFTGGNQQQ